MSWTNKEDHAESSGGEKNYPFARWMSWLFLIASILLLIYTYFRAEITHQGAMGDLYFKYYLISLAGILFWGVVLRLRDGVRANVVTVVTSLVFGLYMIEGGLTFLGPVQPPSIADAAAAAAAELGVEYDERSGLEVIEDLSAEGVDAVPTVGAGHFTDVFGVNVGDLLPLAGVSKKTTVSDNESGKYLIYKSDRHGFNNPDSQWDSKKIEWLLTGDSFTLGVAVQPGQEIAGQIRSITHGSAISLGIAGNGPLVEYAALVEYGQTLKPAKVLWVYYEGNDLLGKSDLKREQINPLLMQYMEDGFTQNLINRQQEIDNKLEKYIAQAQAQAEAQEPTEEPAQLDKIRWIRLFAIRNLISFDVDVDVDVDVENPLFEKILTKAKARVEAWGGELYFVYLPEHSRYNSANILHDSYRNKSELIDLVKGLEISVIDIHREVFADHPDPLALFPFRRNAHYNTDGFSKVAKAIVENIKN
jgi:hypothetical protein